MESLEIALIKYNKKTWSKSALLGFFVGLAVIVPGISGSTIAIIFKLYDQFLYALSNLFKKFKECFAFLLPIGLGMVVGVLMGFFTVQKLLELLPFAIVCLFAGLMCGAFPAVKDELNGAERTPKRIALFLLGVCIPLAIGCYSAFTSSQTVGDSKDMFASLNILTVVLSVIVGAVVGMTQIVPGMSASAFLMAIGWFGSLINSVHLSYWKENPMIFILYFALGIGFLLGLFGFSKLLTYLFSVARHTTYSLIVGLSLGSIGAMFLNGDIIEVYAKWSVNGVNITDLAIGLVLFIIGIVGAYALVRYQRKKNLEK